ncbi:MAG TPA: S9 family peptidase [Nocardioidaceae bacterium]|nr:S9 family peptidase [Nocardioidaceae bacterium]
MNEPASSSGTTPPIAIKRPQRREHHDRVFIDDYEWLRDKSDPETIAYLEAENAYRAEQTAHLEDLRRDIFAEIQHRTQETDLSVPARTGAYWYYSRTVEGLDYPLLCRAPAAGDDWTPPALDAGVPVPGEIVLVDCNALAEGSEFFSISAFSVTPDENLLAYSTDLVGDERHTIYVKDLRTGELLDDRIENTLGDATWSADGSIVFYSTVDDAWRSDKVWRHTIGTDAATDVVVHHEADGHFSVSMRRTTSDRFLLLVSRSRITTEVRILEAADPLGDFRVLVPRTEGVEYSVEHAVIGGADRLVVLHNALAANFTLGVGSIEMTSLQDLDTLVPASDSVRLTDVDVSATTVAVNLRESGLPQVRVFPLTSDGIGEGANISFDEELFSAVATGFSDWRQPLVRLAYSSWVTPATVLEYDPATTQLHLRKRQPVLGGYDPADYVQSREWVTGRDGTRIPVSIVRSAGVEDRSSAPLLLYGYGSYELSMDPYLSISRVSLLDRGMVFAVAHVRGGGEMGREWYEQGKLLQKKNTFTDYVDCAHHLVDTGWTTREQLVGLGGSAGGLLMGAVANMEPDLFAAIVAQVPFVDALTTILDPSLPLTVAEWDEWGDPLHDPEVYDYMASYSPYENLQRRRYPAIYALTSINDTRVFYVEPAKWIAALRATVTGDSPVLLKCEMSAGHGGASGRYDSWRETADYYAWIIDRAGASQKPHVLDPVGVRTS